MRHDNPYYDDEIVERVFRSAHYIVDNMTTIRDTARNTGYSKSLVHNDLSVKLPRIDGDLYEEVQIVIELNQEEKAHRGGMACRSKVIKDDKAE